MKDIQEKRTIQGLSENPRPNKRIKSKNDKKVRGFISRTIRRFKIFSFIIMFMFVSAFAVSCYYIYNNTLIVVISPKSIEKDGDYSIVGTHIISLPNRLNTFFYDDQFIMSYENLGFIRSTDLYLFKGDHQTLSLPYSRFLHEFATGGLGGAVMTLFSPENGGIIEEKRPRNQEDERRKAEEPEYNVEDDNQRFWADDDGFSIPDMHEMDKEQVHI